MIYFPSAIVRAAAFTGEGPLSPIEDLLTGLTDTRQVFLDETNEHVRIPLPVWDAAVRAIYAACPTDHPDYLATKQRAEATR